MTVQDQRAVARTSVAGRESSDDELQSLWNRIVGRRSFLRSVGLAGVATAGATAIGPAGAAAASAEPTAGDVAILKFLAAAEIIESDLWEQYTAFGGVNGKNKAYMAALENLDEDMPQYISDNTDDERSHAAFINAYLVSKGQSPVNLDQFRTLAPSKAKGGGHAPTLTNLMKLNVDTSWYLRYRSTKNPDLGASFGQAVTIRKQPAIPLSDHETPPNGKAPVPPKTTAQRRMQAIANAAGFHFAMIEQGGSSLYTAMAQKVSSPEVLRIVLAIGGTEVNHFAIWHDKAGNAVAQPLAGVTDPKTGVHFPDLNAHGGEATQTNLIMPEPCQFMPGLPDCSIIRPTLDSDGGAMAAVNALTADGLFIGQSAAFFAAAKQLARAADAAQRTVA